jgi:hypothetical protein
MNFDEINKIYEHMRKSVYPNVQTVWKTVSTEEVVIDKYLSVIDDNRIYKLLALPFLVDAESFLKRYKERCIIYYNTPDPNDGLMLYIHQISPTVHLHSRYFCWVENNIVHDYIAGLVFHKNDKEAMEFIDSCFDLAKTGNTEEMRTPSGFNPSGFNIGK